MLKRLGNSKPLSSAIVICNPAFEPSSFGASFNFLLDATEVCGSFWTANSAARQIHLLLRQNRSTLRLNQFATQKNRPPVWQNFPATPVRFPATWQIQSAAWQNRSAIPENHSTMRRNHPAVPENRFSVRQNDSATPKNHSTARFLVKKSLLTSLATPPQASLSLKFHSFARVSQSAPVSDP